MLDPDSFVVQVKTTFSI